MQMKKVIKKDAFFTPYSSVVTIDGRVIDKKMVNGKSFVIKGEKDKKSYDFEDVGTVYIVEIDGGMVIEAFPEEVMKSDTIKA